MNPIHVSLLKKKANKVFDKFWFAKFLLTPVVSFTGQFWICSNNLLSTQAVFNRINYKNKYIIQETKHVEYQQQLGLWCKFTKVNIKLFDVSSTVRN